MRSKTDSPGKSQTPTPDADKRFEQAGKSRRMVSILEYVEIDEVKSMFCCVVFVVMRWVQECEGGGVVLMKMLMKKRSSSTQVIDQSGAKHLMMSAYAARRSPIS